MTGPMLSALLWATASVPLDIEPDPDHRGRGYLGVTFTEQVDGVSVTGVQPGTAARRAGLKPGDLIRTINGTPVRQGTPLLPLIGGKRPGTRLTLELTRDGKPLTLNLRLGARPPEADPPLLPSADDD